MESDELQPRVQQSENERFGGDRHPDSQHPVQGGQPRTVLGNVASSSSMSSETSNLANDSPATGSSGRCLLYGCSAVFVSGLFLILCAGFGTYVYFTRQVKNFTSETAKPLPLQEYDEEKLVELEGRFEDFQRSLELEVEPGEVLPPGKAGTSEDELSEELAKEPPPVVKPKQLILSAEDLNALIARKPQLRNRLFVKIEDGVITGDLSLPLDDFLPGGKGRFFNGSGTFDISLQDGELVVLLVDAMVAEKPLPPVVMSEIRKQNLASEFNQDARTSRSIRRIESIQIEDDRVILTLKQPAP